MTFNIEKEEVIILIIVALLAILIFTSRSSKNGNTEGFDRDFSFQNLQNAPALKQSF